MKLERLHEHITKAVALTAGMVLAFLLGHYTGLEQERTLLLILGGLFVGVLALTVRTNMWIFIPVTWGLYGQIPSLALPFAVRDLFVMAVFVCFLVFKATKMSRRKPTFRPIDLWLYLVIFYLATVYIRNPVGVDALGSDRVGGRPYFVVFIAGLAYWVLNRASATPRQGQLLPAAFALGRSLEGFLSMLTTFFPETVPLLAPFYSTISTETYNSEDIRRTTGESTGRAFYLVEIGHPWAQALIAYFRPLTLINPLYLGRFLLFCVTLVCLLLSGFRSGLIGIGAMMIVNSYLRKGTMDIFRMALFGIPVLTLVLVTQGVLFELPLSAQRALSFLPGRWDQLAVAEAKASTQWRTEMWMTVLSTDRYIENKWLGDGFGFTKRDFEIMQRAAQFGATTEESQETAMITGGVHSGPVSAIRFVGIVGLVLFIILLVIMAQEAVRLVRRAQGTDFFILALYLAVPVIWQPLHFLFIFGGYEGDLPDAIFTIGMLKMLSNTLDDHESRQQDDEPRAPERQIQRPVRPMLTPARVHTR